MIGRQTNINIYYKILLNNFPYYNNIMPTIKSFKNEYKNSIYHLKKVYNSNYSNEY